MVSTYALSRVLNDAGIVQEDIDRIITSLKIYPVLVEALVSIATDHNSHAADLQRLASDALRDAAKIVTESPKIREVVSRTGCTDSEALSYLIASGWDIEKAVSDIAKDKR